MEAKERLYLTTDDRVVCEGDPGARWLFAVVGQKITDAARYGIVDGLAPKAESIQDPDPEPAKKPVKKKAKK